MNGNNIYIEDLATKRIRFTRAGRERYAQRLAKAGYCVDAIQTKEQLAAAFSAMFRREMKQIANAHRGKDAELDMVLTGLPGWDD